MSAVTAEVIAMGLIETLGKGGNSSAGEGFAADSRRAGSEASRIAAPVLDEANPPEKKAPHPRGPGSKKLPGVSRDGFGSPER